LLLGTFSPQLRLLKVCVSEGWNRKRNMFSKDVFPAGMQKREARKMYFEYFMYVKRYLIWS